LEKFKNPGEFAFFAAQENGELQIRKIAPR
jgi:hypothetical protein